jgi:glutamine amidotransferase
VIALIDYQAGNLTSVKKALGAVGAEVFVPQTPDDLSRAGAIIVPGVGHFQATGALNQPWIDAILDRVGDGHPLLGICLGMQWLYESSDEAPQLRGIGLLPGRCVRLGTSSGPGEQAVKVPHVGWNTLSIRSGEAWITDGVPDQAHVYFTHSYIAPVTGDTIASSEHGAAFAAVVQRSHVAGVQFHPEKSGDVGLQILRNFVSMAG